MNKHKYLNHCKPSKANSEASSITVFPPRPSPHFFPRRTDPHNTRSIGHQGHIRTYTDQSRTSNGQDRSTQSCNRRVVWRSCSHALWMVFIRVMQNSGVLLDLGFHLAQSEISWLRVSGNTSQIPIPVNVTVIEVPDCCGTSHIWDESARLFIHGKSILQAATVLWLFCWLLAQF